MGTTLGLRSTIVTLRARYGYVEVTLNGDTRKRVKYECVYDALIDSVVENLCAKMYFTTLTLCECCTCPYRYV